jgi:hypothetical protein
LGRSHTLIFRSVRSACAIVTSWTTGI